MASMCSKQESREVDALAVNKQVANDKTVAVSTEAANTANKPCSTCHGSGQIADGPSALVNIDADIEDEFNQLPPLPDDLPVAHPDFVHCMPPVAPTYRKFSVFTAGSIEMGKAVQWQKLMASMLSHLPITVNNPRRGHWDPNATQAAKDEAFATQVQWELGAMEQADVICFFFDVNTKSPVTMLELGLWAASNKVVVCCDERFWRGGNIHLVCERYGVPLVHNFTELVPAVQDMLKAKGMDIDSHGNLVGSNQHVPKELAKLAGAH